MADQAQLASLLAESPDPISNLNSQLPVSPPVSLEEFIKQCSNLIEGFSPEEHHDPQIRSIRLPKSRLNVTPFQLWESWKMLNQRERTGGLRGGLQASAAGTGKTFIIIGAALLRAEIFGSARKVKAFWKAPTKGLRKGSTAASHLPASASGNGLKCPSQKPGIICYCVPTSQARSFVDAGVAPSGACLLQAPLSVVGQWISVFEHAVLDTSAYNLCIVHETVPARLKRDFKEVMRALRMSAAKGSSAAPETYIFLSSHGNTKVLETFTDEKALSIGVMFSDESHRAMRLESRSISIAKSQSHVGQGLDLWLVSATPIRLLEDWELPVALFSNSSHLSRAAAVADIIAAHVTARRSDEDMEKFREHWAKVFDDKLVLHNTVTSQFCGKAITDLRIIKPNRVWFETPREYLDNVQQIAYTARGVFRNQAAIAKKNKERFEPQYASGVDAGLHFVSLFPGAANLISEEVLEIDEESVTNTIDKMRENKLKVERVAQFQQDLEEIVHGSPKLDFIVAEIGRMVRDNDKRPADPAVQASLHKEDISLKKMVIVTPTLGTAVYLYLFLLKRMLELVPALWHARARPEHREAVLNSFTSLTARKNAKHSHILITPFSAGGTGLNLQSANYQILTSPLSTRDAETQCFGRTNRTGQRLALHHSVLITQDNPADQVNVVNYGGRKIRNDPFEMSRRLVLAEPNGSKAIQRLEDWGYEVDPIDMDAEIPTLLEEYPTLQPSEFGVVCLLLPSVTNQTIDELLYFNSDTQYGDTLVCKQAWNEEYDYRHKHEKIPLREILVSFWVGNLNRPARDLKRIMYYQVVQEHLADEVKPEVYRLMGEDDTTNLVIHRESESPQEAEAYDALVTRTPFCNGASKMLAEYPEFEGVQIESFEFLPHTAVNPLSDEEEPSFSFRINLR